MSEDRITIAVIEDDETVRDTLVTALDIDGFRAISAKNGEEGIVLVKERNPALIIMDVIMPIKDGFEACKELRDSGVSTPIIMLTAKSQEIDKVVGLDMGADDYLAKPFGMKELLARVRAQLRRSNQSHKVEKIAFDDVVIDFKAYKAMKQAEELELSAREYRLLKFLVTKIGAVVTRDELLDHVWGYDTFPTTRTVDNHIARLRQKIERDSDNPQHILTVHGVGYRFVA